jgi:hypothetical protein
LAVWGPHSDIPEVRQKAPTYASHLDIYITAFNILSSDRLNTFGGIGPISFTAMVEFCKWAGIKDQQEFINTLQELDQHYVLTVHKQEEKRSKSLTNGHRSSKSKNNRR